MAHTATLVFTIVQTSAPLAELNAAVAAVVPPYDLLVGLGVFITSDMTVNTVGAPRNLVTRTIVLQLNATAQGGFTPTYDNNSGIFSITALPGTDYGGQPRARLDSAAFANPPSTPELLIQQPVFRVQMQVDRAIVAQQGANYTGATTVELQGGTFVEGEPATAHPTIVGGHITGIVIDSTGGPYCQAPVVKITDPGGGSGAQAMVTLNVGGVEVLARGNAVPPGAPENPLLQSEPFTDLITNGSVAAQVAILSNLMGAAIQKVTRTPVTASPPVVL
jgi:hypothetical protein